MTDPIFVSHLMAELAQGGGKLTYDKNGTSLRDRFLQYLDLPGTSRSAHGLVGQASDGVITAQEINLLSIPMTILDIAGCDHQISAGELKENVAEMVDTYQLLGNTAAEKSMRAFEKQIANLKD